MRAAKRALMVIFGIGLGVCIWANVDVQISYAKSLPSSPQPEAGRTYLFEVNHDCYRYLNKRELEHAKLVQYGLYPLGVVCFLGLVAVKVSA